MILKLFGVVCIVLVTLLYFGFIWEKDVKTFINSWINKTKDFISSDEFVKLKDKISSELKISAGELKDALATEENKKKAFDLIINSWTAKTKEEAQKILNEMQK